MRGPVLAPAFTSYTPTMADADTGSRRPRAIEHSDFYYLRLGIHRYASYAIIPAFVTEYALGQKLYNNPPGSSGTRTAHSVAAIGVVGLFGLNTVTGAWNLWDSRHDQPGRVLAGSTRRSCSPLTRGSWPPRRPRRDGVSPYAIRVAAACTARSPSHRWVSR